jgi:hypothetical protein
MNRITVAVVAVFVVLVGTAWAADLDRNSVKSKQIKDGSIQSIDVADGSLGAIDVADGSLGAADLEPSLTTKTVTAHRSLPVGADTVEVLTVPGVGTVLGVCGTSVISVGYSNRSATEQAVANVVGPPGGGSGSSFSAGSTKPEGTSVAGVRGPGAEGHIRVATSGEYVDIDVIIALTADSTGCEVWAKASVSPLG